MSDNGNSSPEKLVIRYITLTAAALWDNNPKEHDLGLLAASIDRYGFKDAPKFEPSLNDGEGGIVEGNGRITALLWMERQGQDRPRGILEDDDGRWLVPIMFGVDALNELEAESYGIDHNNITGRGGTLTSLDLSRMYDSGAYVDLLRKLQAEGVGPESVDAPDVNFLSQIMSPVPPSNWPSYDEGAAADVVLIKCPHCGEFFPK